MRQKTFRDLTSELCIDISNIHLTSYSNNYPKSPEIKLMLPTHFLSMQSFISLVEACLNLSSLCLLTFIKYSYWAQCKNQTSFFTGQQLQTFA